MIAMESAVKNEKSSGIGSTTDLLARSFSLESEAGDRYAELAQQMHTHNNPEVAELFKELSRIEKLHVDRVMEHLDAAAVKRIAATNYRWEYPEGPETTDMGAVHYLMSPHHALQLALHNEKRAYDFFTRVATEATDNGIVELALEMAAEEQEHVQLVEQWLARYPPPPADWTDDPDEPVGRD